ncbi:MAG: GNAT family N-acetyltransferase [Anaerolineae bacterium]|nr:GNAT family N-acetyltransferase [Thermoflexales bacterium]MDW8396195.1 GNAT family N-acetyltransferase [Anaerolineae bacterium]
MPTLGAQVVPARLGELRSVLATLSPAEIGALDESLSGWLSRPLGREALAAYLLTLNSTYLCLMSYEPAGALVLERGESAARVRLLAVAPDMRRQGLARTMLEAADDLVRKAGLSWLWMRVPSSNLPATRCALRCGYRRYRPQFMRRERARALPVSQELVRAEMLPPPQAEQQLAVWVPHAIQQGDSWCKPLAMQVFAPLTMPAPEAGHVFALYHAARQVGLALAQQLAQRAARVWLWLDRSTWGTQAELGLLKAVVACLEDVPDQLEVEFGSADHLRAAVNAYKTLGFVPVVRDHVLMARRLDGKASR